jgi:hypothetical protein
MKRSTQGLNITRHNNTIILFVDVGYYTLVT